LIFFKGLQGAYIAGSYLFDVVITLDEELERFILPQYLQIKCKLEDAKNGGDEYVPLAL
jgi:hypothetical protein